MTYFYINETNNLPTEILYETENECTELINCTEVSNFEFCKFVSTEEVGNYLRETIPLSHLENCPSIKYQSQPAKHNPNSLGTFYCSSHEIKIWSTCESREEVLKTMTHEVGHNVHENMMATRPELADKWSQMHQASYIQNTLNGTGFVSIYAKTNVYEDFAESYAFYVKDPERLVFYSPEKYEFMKNEVFYGREYIGLWTK